VASHQSVAECAVMESTMPKRTNTLALVVTKIHDEMNIERNIIHDTHNIARNVVLVNRLQKPVRVKFFEKMRSIADGRTVSNPSTIDDETIIDENKTVLIKYKLVLLIKITR
jgi:hypothetical protein